MLDDENKSASEKFREKFSPSRSGDAPPYINFVKRDGLSKAFRADQLVWLDLFSDKKIVLNFASHEVQLRGKGLDVLYRQFLERQVAEVAMSSSRAEFAKGVVLEHMDILQKPTGIPESSEEGDEKAGS